MATVRLILAAIKDDGEPMGRRQPCSANTSVRGCRGPVDRQQRYGSVQPRHSQMLRFFGFPEREQVILLRRLSDWLIFPTAASTISIRIWGTTGTGIARYRRNAAYSSEPSEPLTD